MSTKLDPSEIIKEHLSTMNNESTGRVSPVDVFVFFVAPVVAAALIMLLNCKGFDSSSVGIWIGALSILAGLMINVLVLLYTVKAVGPTEDEENDQIDLIKQVNANLLFSVLVALFAIVLLCIVAVLDGIAERFVSAVIIALLINFTLTILMTLKRLKALVDLRFKA